MHGWISAQDFCGLKIVKPASQKKQLQADSGSFYPRMQASLSWGWEVEGAFENMACFIMLGPFTLSSINVVYPD